MIHRSIVLALSSIAVTAAVQAAPPVVTFEPQAIVVHVQPGAETAILADGFTTAFFPVFLDAFRLADSDNDGIIRYGVKYGEIIHASAIVVNVGTGEYTRATFSGTVGVNPPTLPLPPIIFPNTDGSLSRIIFPAQIDTACWIRPGVGAWETGTIQDEDRQNNAYLFTSAAAFQGAPSSFQAGDVFVTKTHRRSFNQVYYAGVLSSTVMVTQGGGNVRYQAGPFGPLEGSASSIPLMRTDGTANAVSVRLRTKEDPASSELTYQPIDTVGFLPPVKSSNSSTS